MKYLMMLVISLGLVACGSSSDSGGGDENPTSKYTINSLARDEAKLIEIDFKPDYYRANFVVFSMSAKDAGTYTLALKETDETAPTAQEIKDSTATITRELSTTAINLYMPFHIDGTFFDASATQDYATIQDTILSPDTNYTLYILDDDDSVTADSSFKTDLADTTTAKRLYGMPPEKYTFTVKRGEPFILPLRMGSSTGYTLKLNTEIIMDITYGVLESYNGDSSIFKDGEFIMLYHNKLDDSLPDTAFNYYFNMNGISNNIESNFKFEDDTTTP